MIDKNFVQSMFGISGKTAPVTGATGALGGAIAAGYGLQGAKVVLTGRNGQKLEAVCNGMNAAGCECAYVVGDPAIEGDVKEIVKFAVDTFGELNILAACHGFNAPKSIVEQSVDEWQMIMDADCKSVYILTKYAAEQMIVQAKGGKMVIVSSARSKMGMSGYTGYCNSQAALI